MRGNATPFVDLFSVLSMGFFVIMSVTSGRDARMDAGSTLVDDGDEVRVQLYWGVTSGAARGQRPSDTSILREMVGVEPYFVKDGEQVQSLGLDTSVVYRREPDFFEW